MEKKYKKSIKKLIFLIIVSLVAYFVAVHYHYTTIATIFGNMSIGLFTGFVILLITNSKNSYIYQNNYKINKLQDILDKSLDCETKIFNFKPKSEISKTELVYVYTDLANLFSDINEYNSSFYIKNNLTYEELIEDCNNVITMLSTPSNKITITNKEFDKYDWDLSSKMVKIIKLKREIRKEFKTLLEDNEQLHKSIL